MINAMINEKININNIDFFITKLEVNHSNTNNYNGTQFLNNMTIELVAETHTQNYINVINWINNSISNNNSIITRIKKFDIRLKNFSVYGIFPISVTYNQNYQNIQVEFAADYFNYIGLTKKEILQKERKDKLKQLDNAKY